MSLREELDFKENGIDYEHDLPVYHRIQRLLAKIDIHINEFDNEKKISFRSFISILLHFDKTFALLIETLLIKIAQNKEDLEEILQLLQENLSQIDFQGVLIQLNTSVSGSPSCRFIQKLNFNEKLDLAEWFIKEKDRGLFIFDLLKNSVFNQSGINRERCQNLIRQLRQSQNLYLRQHAMEYTVPWNREENVNNNDKDEMNVSTDSNIS